MDSKLTVREPFKTEYDRISDLWFNSWLSTGLGHTSDITKSDLRQRLDNESDRELLVAISLGQVVGMIALKCDASKLDQLFVEPEYQKQGIGRLLVKAAKKRLPHGMWLKVHRRNTSALRFYESQGFVLDLDHCRNGSMPDDVFYRWVPTFD